MKFRIIKKTEKNLYSGDTRDFFFIQKLYFWLFWLDYGNEYTSYKYDNIEYAQKDLKNLQNRYSWKIISKEVVNG